MSMHCIVIIALLFTAVYIHLRYPRYICVLLYSFATYVTETELKAIIIILQSAEKEKGTGKIRVRLRYFIYYI